MKPRYLHVLAIACGTIVIATVIMPVAGLAQDERKVSQGLRELESDVDRLERKVTDLEEEGIAFFVLFLFGVVLAMWAQRNGESGCLWFILGFIPGVNIIAAVIALSKGPDSRRR